MATEEAQIPEELKDEVATIALTVANMLGSMLPPPHNGTVITALSFLLGETAAQVIRSGQFDSAYMRSVLPQMVLSAMEFHLEKSSAPPVSDDKKGQLS